jgi:hypothetical protein
MKIVYDESMSEKISGYILIVVGIIIISASAYSAYAIFTKKAQPADLFNFQPIGIDTNQLLGSALPPEIADRMLNQANAPKTEIIPAALINDSSNIFAHLLLMGFLASIGYKLASLGIMLVRPIVVKLKSKEVTTE